MLPRGMEPVQNLHQEHSDSLCSKALAHLLGHAAVFSLADSRGLVAL